MSSVSSDSDDWAKTQPNVAPIFSVRSGRSSPSMAWYGGMPGMAPKNVSSISCHDSPGARSPKIRMSDAFR